MGANNCCPQFDAVAICLLKLLCKRSTAQKTTNLRFRALREGEITSSRTEAFTGRRLEQQQ